MAGAQANGNLTGPETSQTLAPSTFSFPPDETQVRIGFILFAKPALD
jgi:hypothetical protein